MGKNSYLRRELGEVGGSDRIGTVSRSFGGTVTALRRKPRPCKLPYAFTTRLINMLPNSIKSLVSRFTEFYLPIPPRWTNVSSVVTELGWAEHVVQTGTEYFGLQGVGEKFIQELVGAATRVNYAQDVDAIHALEAAVSLAATGATAIEGGNWRVFDQFVKRSGAKLYLNDKVTINRNSLCSTTE